MQYYDDYEADSARRHRLLQCVVVSCRVLYCRISRRDSGRGVGLIHAELGAGGFFSEIVSQKSKKNRGHGDH